MRGTYKQKSGDIRGENMSKVPYRMEKINSRSFEIGGRELVPPFPWKT